MRRNSERKGPGGLSLVHIARTKGRQGTLPIAAVKRSAPDAVTVPARAGMADRLAMRQPLVQELPNRPGARLVLSVESWLGLG